MLVFLTVESFGGILKIETKVISSFQNFPFADFKNNHVHFFFLFIFAYKYLKVLIALLLGAEEGTKKYFLILQCFSERS